MEGQSPSSKSIIVIPARLHSTRLPRKLLLDKTGKPLIQHTYESASQARRPSGICVAADHQEIVQAVRAFEGHVVMTDADAKSGTDRVAEVAGRLADYGIFVNVQGDEPTISGQAIDLSVRLLEDNPRAPMSTLATPIRTKQQLDDPACVKAVCDGRGRALYFSRGPVPFVREWDDRLLSEEPPLFYRHLGLYAYRRDFLLKFSDLEPSPLERLEKLEQLRVLSAGFEILVGIVDEPGCGIDTPDDYDKFVASYANRTAA